MTLQEEWFKKSYSEIKDMEILLKMLPAYAETLGQTLTDSDTFMRYGSEIVKKMQPIFEYMLSLQKQADCREFEKKIIKANEHQKRKYYNHDIYVRNELRLEQHIALDSMRKEK